MASNCSANCWKKFTQLMVSHDLGMVAHHATHVICLSRRVVAEGSPAQVLNNETLMELFGIHMGLISTASDVLHGDLHA